MLRWILGAVLVMLALAAPASAAPVFADRGVIEGAYGRPWTPAERLALIEWMAPKGFNAYVHAPKDDLWGRTCWREAYPADQQAAFNREIARGHALGVQWIPNLSPALPLIPTAAVPTCTPSPDLCFTCPGDLDVVRAKLAPFLAAGARSVMISFDDVSKAMSHPEDQARYAGMDNAEAFGRANGDFLTALLKAYATAGQPVRILTVGADYSGTADTAYLKGLRATLDPAIGVMWTGTGVPSEDWGPEQARAYGKAIGRRPLVWDNWTNNDTSGAIFGTATTARIFLGPYKRRAAVAATVGGFYFNPANEAHLNKLPLATAAHWMQDPAGYDPATTWAAAVREIAGERRADSLRAWAETSWSNRLEREVEAPTFTRLSAATLDAYRTGGAWTHPFDALRHELALVRAAPETIPAIADGAFAAQAQPFLLAAARGADAGYLGARLLAAERPSLSASERFGGGFAVRAQPPRPEEADDLRSRLGSARTKFTSDPRFTYGWRGGVAFDVPPYTVAPNVMTAFLDAVQALDQEFQPRAQEAADGVQLTLDGRAVTLDAGGGALLPASACGSLLVATDASGGATARRLTPCATACVRARATLTRVGLTGVSGARLGRKRPGRSVRAVCGGGRVAVLVRRGRVVAVATSAPGHRARGGVRPGARLRLSQHARRIGPSLRRTPRGTVLLVGRGRIRAIAVARRGVSPRSLRRLTLRTRSTTHASSAS